MVLEEDFAQPVEVLVLGAVRGQVRNAGMADGVVDEVVFGEVDSEVEGEFFGAATGETVIGAVDAGDAFGDPLEAADELPPPGRSRK